MCILLCMTIANHEVCQQNREEMSNSELLQFHECFGYDDDNPYMINTKSISERDQQNRVLT